MSYDKETANAQINVNKIKFYFSFCTNSDWFLFLYESKCLLQ